MATRQRDRRRASGRPPDRTTTMARSDGIARQSRLNHPVPLPTDGRTSDHRSSPARTLIQVIEAHWAIALGIILAGAVLIRLFVATALAMHQDESSSILAAQMVVEHGLPILPSGTPYFQGATLSYILAPILLFGVDGFDEVLLLRLPGVLAGTLAVGLAFGLARSISGRCLVGLIAALLLTLEPTAIQWSGHVRMYGLVQPVGILVAWLMVRLSQRRDGLGTLVPLVGLMWFGVFTHVGFSLLLLPVGLIAAITWGWRFWRWPLARTSAMLFAASAPVALILLNRVLVPQWRPIADGATEQPEGQSISFVGDSLLSLGHLAPSQWLSHLIIPLSMLAWLGPLTLVVLSLAVLTAIRIGRPQRGLRHGWKKALLRPSLGTRPVVVLGLCFIIPVLAVVILIEDPFRNRYYVQVTPVGIVALSVAATNVLTGMRGKLWPITNARRAAAVVLMSAVVANSAGAGWLLTHTSISGDYRAALTYVLEQREPGDIVVIDWPVALALELDLDELEDTMFLAGPYESARMSSYTWRDGEGVLRDYWLGVEAIGSAVKMYSVLTSSRPVWIVVHEDRWDDGPIFDGPMKILVEARIQYVCHPISGIYVFRMNMTPNPPGVEPIYRTAC